MDTKFFLKFISYLLLIVAVCSTMAYADPQILSVKGDVGHKQHVYISGKSFGVKNTPAPIRYDNFESGAIQQSLSGYYTTTAIAGRAPSYSNVKIRYSGTQSAYQDFRDGNYSNYIRLTEEHLPPNLKKVYVSGWFNLVTGGAPSRNTKILNMGAGSGWQTRLDVYPTNGSGHLYAYQSCSGGGGVQDWSANAGKALLDDGQWHRIEGWLDLGTPNGDDGYRDVWMDLRKIGQISGNFIDSDCGLTYVSFGHYFATDTGSPTPWAERYWDELYIDSTRARVEIGNRETWGACTHREIQIPVSWGASNIECLINKGTFKNGETAYLYVVDENGDVNSQGFPVVFGQSGGSGNAIPAPDNLVVLPSAR